MNWSNKIISVNAKWFFFFQPTTYERFYKVSSYKQSHTLGASLTSIGREDRKITIINSWWNVTNSFNFSTNKTIKRQYK